MLESGIGAFTRPPAIAAEGVAFAMTSGSITVTKRRQFRFASPVAAAPGAIIMVIVDRLTYFEPDFRIEEGIFYWQRDALPIGAVIKLEVWVGGVDHWRAERVVIEEDARDFRLSAPSIGNQCEIFVNGRCFTEREGAFATNHASVRWLAQPAPTSADAVIAVYPRTMEGAMALRQEAFELHPSRSRAFDLAIEPRPAGRTRLYHRGLRYFETVDFPVSGSSITAPAAISFDNGETIAVVATTDANYFVKTAEVPAVPRQVFVESHLVVTANGQASLALPAALLAESGKSLVDVNGLSYPEGAGSFTRAGASAIWSDADLALKIGDDIGMIGLLGDRAGDACVIKEVQAAAGYPNIDLGEQAADVRKTMLFVSAGETLGGQLYLGPRWLIYPNSRTIRWNGAFPLKATDRLVVVFWKDPLVAAELNLHFYSVSLSEAGQAFAYRLPRSPADAGRMVVAQNGQRLSQPKDFTMLGPVFNYGLSGIRPVVAGDEFAFLYR